MGNITRLVGDDGLVLVAATTTEKTGDGTKTFDVQAGGIAASGKGKGFWQITGIGTTTPFFSWAGVAVGDFFYDDGTGVMKTGDKAIFVAGVSDAPQATVKSFSLEVSREEFDLTAFEDAQKISRYGKTTVSGSISVIEDLSRPFFPGKFFDRLTVSGSTKTKIKADTGAFFFVGFLQSEQLSGETQVAIVGKVEAGSYSQSAQSGSSQESTISIKPTVGGAFQRIEVSIT
jgi:hypothetical protein